MTSAEALRALRRARTCRVLPPLFCHGCGIDSDANPAVWADTQVISLTREVPLVLVCDCGRPFTMLLDPALAAVVASVP